MRELRDILANHSKNYTNLEIFGIEFHKCAYFLDFGEISSSRCPNLGKFGHCNAQNKGNSFIVMNKIREICSLRLKEMHKFVAKYGGYCPKLEKNMVGLYPKTYNQMKKCFGYTRKHIIKWWKFRLYVKEYN